MYTPPRTPSSFLAHPIGQHIPRPNLPTSTTELDATRHDTRTGALKNVSGASGRVDFEPDYRRGVAARAAGRDIIIINNSNERQLRSHNYQIRPIHKLNTVRSNQNFFNRIVTIWNELPSTTNFNSINSFTNSISKNFLARHCRLNFN